MIHTKKSFLYKILRKSYFFIQQITATAKAGLGYQPIINAKICLSLQIFAIHVKLCLQKIAIINHIFPFYNITFE